MVGRIVLWHRIGELALGESSVVVAVSSPHRPEAFEAARFGIDALKATAPIWKKETWEGRAGASWAARRRRVMGARSPGHHRGGRGRIRRVPEARPGALMRNLIYLLVAVGVIALGILVLALRAREPKGFDSGIKAHQRHMDAPVHRVPAGLHRDRPHPAGAPGRPAHRPRQADPRRRR